MKKIVVLILTIVLACSALFAIGTKETRADEEDVIFIGISKLVSHPGLDTIQAGITDYLDASEKYTFRYDVQNANGDISAAIQIAQVFNTEKTDINIGIATATAQALANTAQDTPLIFASVTDPVEAGLTGIKGVGGVSDMVPVDIHLNLIMQILPEIENLGMLYTSGEPNGIVLMEAMKKECEQKGINLVTTAVTNSSEVMMAAESIIDRVDAMYLPTDNTVATAVMALAEVSFSHGKPLFTADAAISYGTQVLLAGGFDYYAAGLLTGEIVERFLDGEALEDIGTVYLDRDSLEIYLNLDVASELGLSIPEEIISSAAILISEGDVINRASN